MAFFVLKIGTVTQYRYAWFEAADGAKYGDASRCSVCHRFVGMRQWLPPHVVELKQRSRVGDFVWGFGGCAFLVQARVVAQWRARQLSGMEHLHRVVVAGTRSTPRSKGATRRDLIGVDVPRSATRVVYDQMTVTWTQPPAPTHCTKCGPGGGGTGGILKSWRGVAVDQQSWGGEDLFEAANFPGVVLISERGADLVRTEAWTNVTAVPAEDYAHAFGA